ncbi:MAG: ATP-binding cassette domain-containing protein [Gammaproteobacteria bacterium]|nr:ATP-binding cassette domain-containing protein [Gammaproteobacteria bacterium]
MNIPAKKGSIVLSCLQVKNIQTHHVGPLSLTVTGDAAVSLRGQSGCGKSLLMRAIADIDPHQGEVLLNNTPREEFSGSQWRKNIGYLPAVSQWWGDYVREHFDEKIDQHQISKWLAALGLNQAVLEAATATLSSGERQRLALIRLLANRPQVLLLDEPTASLDPENVTRIETLIGNYQLQHKSAVMWISHDHQQLQRVASRHFIIKQGTLIEQEAAWR